MSSGAVRRTRARLGRLVAVLAMASVSLVGATLAVTASPASAGGPTEFIAKGIPIENISQEDGVGRCLDDSSLGLRAIPCNGLPFQHWDWNGYTQVYEFVNNATGGCLADGFFGPHTERCNGGGSFQTWRQVRTGELMNVGTGLCLDYSNQYLLRTVGCNAGWGGYQYWWL